MQEDRESESGGTRAGVADAVVGILVMSVSLAALLAGQEDPGELPETISFGRVIALALGVAGAAVAINALLTGGPRLKGADVRAVAFLGGAALLFGVAIEPLGLLVAGPASAITAAFATEEVRPLEAVAFSGLLTLLALFICNFVLDLQVPVAPFL